MTGTIAVTSAATQNQPVPVQEINCTSTSSANCVAAFDAAANAPATVVTLTATPSNGEVFAGWSGGGCTGNSTTCAVVMTQAQNVTATFNTAPAASCGVNCGDVNGVMNNGQPVVTIVDAELTAQEAIGVQVSGFITANALVDGGTTVDINDAFLIAEYAVRKITSFPF